MATLNLTKLATASIILDGEKVAVKKILKTKEEVIMMNGDRLPLASIRAVGRGFVYDAPVKSGKTSAKPAAVKPAAKANAAVPGRGAPVTAEELSEPGKHVRTKDGERLAVDSVIKSKGIIKLAGNVRVELANIVRRGQGYVELDVTDVPATPANKPSAKPAAKPANTPAKPAHVAIDVSKLRDARVKVGGRYETIDKLFPSKGQVKTDKGTRLEIANIQQKGTKYIYVEADAAPAPTPAPAPKQKAESAPQTGGIRRRAEVVDIKTGSSKPAADKTPTAKPSKLRKVEAMTFDLSEEIRMAAEALVKDAVTKMFDLKFVTSAAVFNNEVLTVDCTFALGSFSPKQIATLIAEMKAEEEDDDSEEEENEDDDSDDSDDSEEDDSEEEEDDNEEFDDSELTGTDDDDSEEEEDDSEDDDSEEEEDDDDSDDENEFENDDDDSEEEEEDEIEAKIEAGVAALEKKFGKHSSFRNYAENYLLSDAVEKAFGDDMVVGVTKLNTDKGVYTLVGLHDDGTVVLINNKTQKLRKCEIAAVARMEEV